MFGYTPHMEKPYIDEMMPDIIRLMHKTARSYTDNTCYALRFEDLVSEQMVKLTKLLQPKKGTNKNAIEVIPNRHEAFRFLATCLKNQVRGLVIKHRQTKKRTIQSSGDEDAFSERTKHCEISIDSEEAGIQIQDLVEAESGGAETFIRDLSPLLSPLELMVIKDINEPSKETLCWMMLDHSLGRLRNESIKKYKLKFSHHAKGLGIPLDLFKQTVKKIGEKITMMRQQEQDSNEPIWNAAVTRLEEFFMVQIPRSMERVIVKRLFTIAARDQFQRWQDKPEVRDDLVTIGAQLPQSRAGLVVCYGVLYEKQHKVCRACSLYESCGKEAANIGLGEITIHPRLLNNRQIRVPIISASVVQNTSFQLEPKYAAVYNWVRDHFTFIEDDNGKIKFKRPGVAGTNATALAVTATKKPFSMILHSVEDPALTSCELLKRVGESDDFEIVLNDSTTDQLLAILSTHLSASYALNDADSVI